MYSDNSILQPSRWLIINGKKEPMFEPKQVSSSEKELEKELRGYMLKNVSEIIDTVNEYTKKYGEPTEGYYWINDAGQVFLYLKGGE